MMKNEKTTGQTGQNTNEVYPKGDAHVHGYLVKTSFEKNQSTPPFQGYNYFGTKPKWD